MAFLLGGETVEQLRVFTHDEMRIQRDILAGRRQLIEGAHGNVDFITDAMHIDQYLRRPPFEQPACNFSDHTNRPRFMR